MVPMQRATVQGMVNPREFSPNDWKFNVARAQDLDWQKDNDITSDFNFFARSEPFHEIKNGMFNPLTGQEPIYGHVNYKLNPLQQEQTNAKMSGYQNQKQTRVRDNMSPVYSMRFPAYQYPSNGPPNVWANVYMGSRTR